MKVLSRPRSRVCAVIVGTGLAALVAAGGSTVGAAGGNPAASIAGAGIHNQLLNQREIDVRPEPPNLSALCQSELGQPNPYTNPAPNVDVINDDAVVSAGSQTGCRTAQNETTIAVNPENPNNLVAGANDYRVFNTREGRNDGSGVAYTTTDGGRTWRNIILPGLTFQTGATGALSDMDSAGDPAIAFGPHNVVYYANLVFSRSNDCSGIVVSKSTDGGRTWGQPSIVRIDGVDAAGSPMPTNVSHDKEWIATDPITGAVYVSWTQFRTDGTSPITISRSTDGGASWTSPTVVNPTFTAGGITPYSQGSVPVVRHTDDRRGGFGELFVAYESAVCQSLNCDQPTDHDATIVARSTDGGATFTNTEIGVNYDFPPNQDVGRSTLTGENFRNNSFPMAAIDRNSGRLYVTWADDRNGAYSITGASVKTNGDVVLASSMDGRRFSTNVVGSAADEVFPAVAAVDGKVAITFYTRAYDPNGIGLDYAAYAGNGPNGIANASMRRLSTQTSNPQVQFLGIGLVSGTVLQGEFIGDYSAVAMGSDLTLHAAWTDFRGRPGTNTPNQDVYTQAVRLDR